jgi:hypothetical protein
MNKIFSDRQQKHITELMEHSVHVCKKCNVEKRISDFDKDNRCKFGRSGVCKKCKMELTQSVEDTEKERYFRIIGDKITEVSYEEFMKPRIESRKKQYEKRKNYKWKSLNEPFVGSERHHINKEYVIHMPKALHNYFGHCLDDGRGMVEINTLAFEYLFSNPKKMSFPHEFVIKIKDEVLP